MLNRKTKIESILWPSHIESTNHEPMQGDLLVYQLQLGTKMSDEEYEDVGEIVLPALIGYGKRLGSLFDATKQTFIGDTMLNLKDDESVIFLQLKSRTPQRYLMSLQEEIDEQDIATLKTVYEETDNSRQKEALLDVGGELSISIKGGMISGEVKLDYLNREKKNRSEKSVSCMLRMTTKQQSFIPRQMLDKIYWEVLADTEATHVLTGKYYYLQTP